MTSAILIREIMLYMWVEYSHLYVDDDGKKASRSSPPSRFSAIGYTEFYRESADREGYYATPISVPKHTITREKDKRLVLFVLHIERVYFIRGYPACRSD